MKLDIETIKALAENIEENNIGELTIETEDGKLTLKRESQEFNHNVIPSNIVMPNAMQQISMPFGDASYQQENPMPIPEEKNLEEDYESICSPMVGTFYRSPSPEADVFVKEGDVIHTGQTLCIVEAMKLMNEVKSTINGKIVKILLKDGDGVKKGDSLFLVEEQK